MSIIIFERSLKTLSLVRGNGELVGRWEAGNNVDSSVGLAHLPCRDYLFEHQPHVRHGPTGGDTTQGKYGPMGIFVIRPFYYDGVLHSGVGIHSGKKDIPDKLERSGTQHATFLCIRTTDVAMSMIKQISLVDPLKVLSVRR